MEMSKMVQHIKNNGGITYNMKTREIVTSGYAVSPYKHLEKIVSLDTFITDDLEHFIIKNNEVLALDNVMLGAWLSCGNVYLDITIVLQDKDKAIKLAKDNNQLAIFNLDTFEEVKTV